LTTRDFRGARVDVETGVGVGIDCGVGSGGGVVDARSIFGLGVGVAATAIVDFDWTGGASKAAFSRPEIEIKITRIEAAVTNFRI
jgi:hypothetical protein